MNRMTRRRFLTDLAFIGGGLLCAVGGAWVAEPEVAEAAPAKPSPKPSPSPRPVLKGEPAPDRPLPGYLPAQAPSPSPRPTPQDRPLPGEMVAPPPQASPKRPLPGKTRVPGR